MSDKRRECVKVEKRDGIAWVIMNRPDKRNAMSPQLHYEMDEALEELETDNDAKVANRKHSRIPVSLQIQWKMVHHHVLHKCQS